jgi:hypothetical protein
MRVTKSVKTLIGAGATLSAVAALVAPAGAVPNHAHPREASTSVIVTEATPTRTLPTPIYGVTADNVGNVSDIVAGARRLPEMPTTRIYFNVKAPATSYVAAVRAIQPASYVMGELLDSSDSRRISPTSYNKRVKSYLSVLGSSVDVWEIGNEVNGNWTGRYSRVETKLTDAYNDVAAAGGRSALTLYYNVGCGDGPRELDPITFSQQYVPATVRDGLDYVLLSYYEGNCQGIRPTAASWTAYFARLHALYPVARVGFGEIGMDRPVTGASLGAARSIMNYYYGLDISLPYYVGGYFWWYYDEDCLPPATGPLWANLQTAFSTEATALSH